jgi:hypothetical protein
VFLEDKKSLENTRKAARGSSMAALWAILMRGRHGSGRCEAPEQRPTPAKGEIRKKQGE